MHLFICVRLYLLTRFKQLATRSSRSGASPLKRSLRVDWALWRCIVYSCSSWGVHTPQTHTGGRHSRLLFEPIHIMAPSQTFKHQTPQTKRKKQRNRNKARPELKERPEAGRGKSTRKRQSQRDRKKAQQSEQIRTNKGLKRSKEKPNWNEAPTKC